MAPKGNFSEDPLDDSAEIGASIDSPLKMSQKINKVTRFEMDNALKKTVTGLIKLNTAKLEKNEAGKAEKPQESDVKQKETSEGFEDTLVDFVYPMVED